MCRRANDYSCWLTNFADIIVGLAGESNREAGGEKRAKRLASGADQIDAELAAFRETRLAMSNRDLVAHTCAECSIDVCDRLVERSTRLALAVEKAVELLDEARLERADVVDL